MGEGLAAHVVSNMYGNGADMADVYDSIYKTVIKWRNANNTVSSVELETVGEAIEQCMAEVGGIRTGVKYINSTNEE